MGISFSRLRVAARAQIDGRNHVPALPVFGTLPEARLDPGDERFEVAVARRIFEAGGERLVGKAGRAENEVEPERDQRKAHADDGDGGFGRGPSRLAAVGTLRFIVGGKEPPRDFDARGFGFFFADQTAGAIAFDLVELIAIDGGVEGFRRKRFRPRDCERTQQDEQNDCREAGEDDPDQQGEAQGSARLKRF